MERKRATVSKALDKAIDQTRGAIKYVRRQEDLHFHFGDEIIEIETHDKGAVAGAECNTVIELKPEHHAALPWHFA